MKQQKSRKQADLATLPPIAMECVSAIQADSGMNFLQRSAAIAYLLERISYRPPEDATSDEIKRVLLSAARAEAGIWFPAGLSEAEMKKRVWLHRYIMADERDEHPAPPFKMCLSEWTNFFRSADQARQTYRGQTKVSPLKEIKFHPTIKSFYLPMESLWIVYRWASPDPCCVSLAHCTAELACEIIAGVAEAAHDPKNFGRKRKQLGLVSYSRAELRGHLKPAYKPRHCVD